MGHATTVISTSLSRAIALHADALAQRLPDAIDGDVRAVHRARVASRRLRETLAIAASAAPGTGAVRLSRDVRRVTRALGPVREMDVSRETLDAAASRHAWPPDRVAAMRARLEKVRARRRARMTQKLSATAARDLLDRAEVVADAIAATTESREWRRALAARIARRAAEARTAIARCGTLYAPDRLHAARITVKKLRYALESAADAGVDPTSALETLKAAQERFGALHDLQVLQDELRVAASAKRGMPRSGWRVLVDGLERECRGQHADLVAGFPDLVARITAVRRDLVPVIRGGELRMARASSGARGRTSIAPLRAGAGRR